MTEVILMFYEGRIEHWLRFGTEDCERILDRRRRIISFAAGKIFAFVRWEANEYGTVLSRLDILRASDAGEIVATVPGVTPGGEILLRLASWPRVRRAFDAIAQIEARGIDPTTVAPDWWRHLHNRITCNLPYRAYTRGQHAVMYIYVADLPMFHARLSSQGVPVKAIEFPEYNPAGEVSLCDENGYLVRLAQRPV